MHNNFFYLTKINEHGKKSNINVFHKFKALKSLFEEDFMWKKLIFEKIKVKVFVKFY